MAQRETAHLTLDAAWVRRLWLDTARSSKISSKTLSWNAARSPGGKSGEALKFAANNSDCVNEREPVRVFIRPESRCMHQATDGEVGHQQTVEFLTHQVRRLATQDDASSPQVGFQCIQGRLNLPAFVVQCCQFRGRSPYRVEDGGNQAINGLGSSHPHGQWERGNHTEVATTTAYGPEKIFVFFGSNPAS